MEIQLPPGFTARPFVRALAIRSKRVIVTPLERRDAISPSTKRERAAASGSSPAGLAMTPLAELARVYDW